MVSFDGTILPGSEGKITLSVRTGGYEGTFHKKAWVYTNDPKMDAFTLSVRAFVLAPVYVSPLYVRLYGNEGQRLTRVVEIKAGLKKPLALKPDKFSLDGIIKYEIEEIKRGRKFRIHFTSNPKIAGNFNGFLTLKTNYDEKPVINIEIRARFAKAKRLNR